MTSYAQRPPTFEAFRYDGDTTALASWLADRGVEITLTPDDAPEGGYAATWPINEDQVGTISGVIGDYVWPYRVGASVTPQTMPQAMFEEQYYAVDA